MSLLLLEALGALLALLLIVWWTMFSGRTRGELRSGAGANTDITAEASNVPIAQQIGQLDR